MEGVQQSMLDALTHTNKRVYAIDLDALLCTEDLAVQEAAWDIAKIHEQACKSICSLGLLLHRSSVVPHLQTYINVYLLWYACMRAVFDTENLQPNHPKHAVAEYIKRMPSRKLTVIVPAVCFWVSLKCSESFGIKAQNVADMIHAVHQGRGDDSLFEYSVREVCDTEHAALQLLDFDILQNQDKIDKMEKTIRAHFGEAYESKEAQSQIVRSVSSMFQEVADNMN